MVFTAIKSSVDVDRITFNTFLQAYKHQLDKAKLPQQALLEEIKNAKQVFALLRSPVNGENLNGGINVMSLPSSNLE